MSRDKYGLNSEDIDGLLFGQRCQCPICDKLLIEGKRVIDHDHKSGEVRGILCYRCNQALGIFKDNIQFLENAIKYLKPFILKIKRRSFKDPKESWERRE